MEPKNGKCGIVVDERVQIEQHLDFHSYVITSFDVSCTLL